MMAVVPSAPAVFGSAFSASKRKAVARSPASAASSNFALAAPVALPNAREKEHKRHKKHKKPPRNTLDLRQRVAAVADRFHRDFVPVEDRQQQIGMARI